MVLLRHPLLSSPKILMPGARADNFRQTQMPLALTKFSLCLSCLFRSWPVGNSQASQCLVSAAPKDDCGPCLSAFLFSPLQVLRFYAIWDDTNCAFGDHHPCIIHYFLADDTVEVREIHKRNDGRDPFPVLMRRQRLPKIFVDKNSKIGTSICAKVSLFHGQKKFFKWSLNSLSFEEQWQECSASISL